MAERQETFWENKAWLLGCPIKELAHSSVAKPDVVGIMANERENRQRLAAAAALGDLVVA